MQQIRLVIVPHIAKTIYPALANFFIVILVMGTSIGAVVGVDELTGQAINISTENYRWIEMFTVVAGLYVMLTLHRQPRLGAVRPLGLPGQGEGVLMERVINEIPRFFSPANIYFLLQGMATTLTLTLVGCVLAFLLAFLHRFCAPDARLVGVADAARRDRLCRDLPPHPVPRRDLSRTVLHRGLRANASLFAIAVVAICIYSTAYTADIIRGGFESVARQQIEAATAMNFSRWQTLTRVIMPQSWPVILPPAIVFMVSFIKDTVARLPGRRVRTDLPGQGAEQ